jgi:hypothetical protein
VRDLRELIALFTESENIEEALDFRKQIDEETRDTKQ